MSASKNSQSGFSLIEMLVAVVILAIGLLGLAQLQVTAIKTNSQSASSTAAAGIAQRYVERISAMSPSDPMFDAAGSGTLATSVLVEGAGTYLVEYNVSPVAAGTGAVTNLFQVEIVVTSTSDVMHVLGNRPRIAKAYTLKRAI